jgi:protein phosphatase 1L
MDSFDNLEKANILYKNGNYNQAAEAYSKIATDLYIRNENSDLGEIAMKLAIEAYRQIIDPVLLFHILKDSYDNLFLQFFAIRCYIKDHNIENDPKLVQSIIHQPIKLNEAERRFYFYNTVVPTLPNKLFSVSYNLGPFHAFTAAAQGPREKMEDFNMGGELDKKIPIFAIFDGHGGDGCAKFVKNQLKKQLSTHLKTDDDLSIYNTLTYACITIDENWKNYVTRSSAKFRDFSGSTALFVLIIENALWVVSIGDSRAVLGQDEEATQLSEDAKPPIEKFQKEIMERGGFVKWKRVDGSLDMARSVGDIDHPSVSAKPCIRKFELNKLDPKKKNILILATDGLWDVIGSHEAIQLCQNGKSGKEKAAELVSAAYINGSTDNTTVMVIQL